MLPDRLLTTENIIKYVDKLNIRHFRDLFFRDDLPEILHTDECGI